MPMQSSHQLQNFNPRSRVGNDYDLAESQHHDAISIHVPAWGTTQGDALNGVRREISIHVPAWGTTQMVLVIAIDMRFQSTFPRGERHELDSMHVMPENFNPRSRVGNDSKFQQFFTYIFV